jgi:hypothetical protein
MKKCGCCRGLVDIFIESCAGFTPQELMEIRDALRIDILNQRAHKMWEKMSSGPVKPN